MTTAESHNARDGAIIFGDLIGKLDMLRVSCDSARSGVSFIAHQSLMGDTRRATAL